MEAFHQFKSNKENADLLYLINASWLKNWIDYLKGMQESPDYICNEQLYQTIFELQQAHKLKMDEDFILVHKSLFEYLYSIYGCDYFIQAKQFTR